jgi:hypothetical protein
MDFPPYRVIAPPVNVWSVVPLLVSDRNFGLYILKLKP